jgi:hypothetical protein
MIITLEKIRHFFERNNHQSLINFQLSSGVPLRTKLNMKLEIRKGFTSDEIRTSLDIGEHAVNDSPLVVARSLPSCRVDSVEQRHWHAQTGGMCLRSAGSRFAVQVNRLPAGSAIQPASRLSLSLPLT